MEIVIRLTAITCFTILPALSMQDAIKEMMRWTPLIRAVNGDSLEMVALLLQQGVPVDEKDQDGNTALIHASENGHDAIVRILLKYGASVNLADGQLRRTPIYFAAYSGHVSTMKILVEAGALIDQPSTGGATPLMTAAKQGHAKAVTYLLSQGANIYAQNYLESTALGAAAQFGKVEAVKELLTAKPDLQKGTPLHRAAQKGHVEIVRLLLDAGADPDATDKIGQTPLLLATVTKQQAVIDLLLHYKADPNWSSSLGTTPLACAAAQRHPNAVEAMLSAGATPDAVSPNLRPFVDAVQNKTLCAVCTTPTAKKCGSCKVVYYCSQKCQSSDWANHKEKCKN